MEKLPFGLIMGLKLCIHQLNHMVAWYWDEKLSIQNKYR